MKLAAYPSSQALGGQRLFSPFVVAQQQPGAATASKFYQWVCLWHLNASAHVLCHTSVPIYILQAARDTHQPNTPQYNIQRTSPSTQIVYPKNDLASDHTHIMPLHLFGKTAAVIEAITTRLCISGAIES